MIKNFLRKRGVKMPEYFDSDSWHYCSVKVRSVGSRKVPIMKHFIPVYVGSKFRFKLEITRLNYKAESLEGICIYEF